jgi:hypothetical protein
LSIPEFGDEVEVEMNPEEFGGEVETASRSEEKGQR